MPEYAKMIVGDLYNARVAEWGRVLQARFMRNSDKVLILTRLSAGLLLWDVPIPFRRKKARATMRGT
jgi:hypothetical protein